MKRTIIAALAAIAVLGATQTAASAATTWSVKRTYTTTAGSVTQAATGTVQKEDATTLTVSLECTADAPGAAALGITDCYLFGTGDGARYDAPDAGAFPGEHARRVGVFHGIRKQPYRVCVKTNVFFRATSTFYAAPRSCSL